MKFKPAHLALIAAAVGGVFLLKNKDAHAASGGPVMSLTPGRTYVIETVLRSEDYVDSQSPVNWGIVEQLAKKELGNKFFGMSALPDQRERVLKYTMTVPAGGARMQEDMPLFQLHSENGDTIQAFFKSAVLA